MENNKKFISNEIAGHMDKKIANAQAWNLAVARLGNSTDEHLEYAHAYFYNKLMEPYFQAENKRSPLERKEEATESAEQDQRPENE